ncbi:interleukin-17F-like [Hyperolius riggenbachi]|uniref:interleukin-17F-like n=1 Tax=Hyperolius riggenbachi TaxID=752182 RepID=UPI0035A2CC29
MDSLLEAVDFNRHSRSPWEYRLNTDPDRYPSVISEADCLTFSCAGMGPDLFSYPIQQEVMVLRRQQRDCDYTYSLETELVTQGCTCVQALSVY